MLPTSLVPFTDRNEIFFRSKVGLEREWEKVMPASCPMTGYLKDKGFQNQGQHLKLEIKLSDESRLIKPTLFLLLILEINVHEHQ